MRSTQKLGATTVAQVLRGEGLLHAEDIEDLAQEHRATGERLSDLVVSRGLATEFDIARAVVRQLQLPFLPLQDYQLPDEVRGVLPPPFLRTHQLVPLDRFGDLLVLATTGDLDQDVSASIQNDTGCKVAYFVALKSQIERVLDEHFPAEDVGREVVSRLDELFGG